MLELAEPVLRRQKFRLAVENHKDQRVPERLELFKQRGSEWIGACVDVGNSFALCEDALEVVRAYAPLAWTVHLKDQALAPCEDGIPVRGRGARQRVSRNGSFGSCGTRTRASSSTSK